ncbi:MAG TPA: hypothetical protein PKA81_05395 [Clostridia bacterium]|nr:hypothetical protein [Clostridia bacterium]
MEIYSWGGVKLSSAPTARELSIAPSPQRAEHFLFACLSSGQLAMEEQTPNDLLPSQLYSFKTD